MSDALHRCPDCHWHDGGSVSPCVRHNGCEHGLPGDYDDTWEHWRKRALAAEAELAEARRQLGEVTRERDALKTGRHAEPWKQDSDGRWYRHLTRAGGGIVAVAISCTSGGRIVAAVHGDIALLNALVGDIHHWRGAHHLPAAKAAADAHLIANGWWLEGGQHGAGEAK